VQFVTAGDISTVLASACSRLKIRRQSLLSFILTKDNSNHFLNNNYKFSLENL